MRCIDNCNPCILIEGKGASNGTVTDLDGNFQIAANTGQKLKITYIGYEPASVIARNGMTVKLKESATTLKDVEVVAYGQYFWW